MGETHGIRIPELPQPRSGDSRIGVASVTVSVKGGAVAVSRLEIMRENGPWAAPTATCCHRFAAEDQPHDPSPLVSPKFTDFFS